jgi:hypothetical protein
LTCFRPSHESLVRVNTRPMSTMPSVAPCIFSSHPRFSYPSGLCTIGGIRKVGRNMGMGIRHAQDETTPLELALVVWCVHVLLHFHTTPIIHCVGRGVSFIVGSQGGGCQTQTSCLRTVLAHRIPLQAPSRVQAASCQAAPCGVARVCCDAINLERMVCLTCMQYPVAPAVVGGGARRDNGRVCRPIYQARLSPRALSSTISSTVSSFVPVCISASLYTLIFITL